MVFSLYDRTISVFKAGQAADGTEDESVLQFATRDFYAWLSCQFWCRRPDSNWHNPIQVIPDFKSHPALTQHHSREIPSADAEAQVVRHDQTENNRRVLVSKRVKLAIKV